MSHALTRTNPTGRPFVGRCIKCGQEGLRMTAVAEDCPADHIMSDEAALFSVLEGDDQDREGRG
ncbi:MAG: hypothetical protein VYD87_17160 [Pseudomonadota bacterium]|nr:hypothetical protein [Pseudomonadota bacterium]MEE3101330.1 hypothetical protein [Pseudomonadota bacterium]